MGSPFAAGKRAIAICDRCGLQFKLAVLRAETVRGRSVSNRVCPSCWDLDHPQNFQGMYPIDDPQALRDPRPDTALVESRDYAWGWNPVGGGDSEFGGPNNPLQATGAVGTVTVSIA